MTNCVDKDKRIFFFDIDKTLYDPEIRDFPESTKEALRKLTANGHQIYIATSRSESEMENVMEVIKPYDFTGFITCGGALTRVRGEIVDAVYMEPKDVRTVVEYCEEAGVDLRWQGLDELYFCGEPSKFAVDTLMELFNKVPPVKQWSGEPVLRFLAYVTPRQRDELQSRLKAVELVQLSETVVDIMHEGIHKGSAMLNQAAREGFTREQIVAFGDGDNDTEMIAAAGTGIAMGNARNMPKEAADYVTTDIGENGIHNACAHFGWIAD